MLLRRADLLVGRVRGQTGLSHCGFSLHDFGQHIVHTLRRAGYESTLIGVQHVAQDAAAIGYDRVMAQPGNRSEHITPAAVSLLRQSSVISLSTTRIVLP